MIKDNRPSEKTENIRNDIMAWIEKSQEGKGGIYPYQVALEVCAIFGIHLDNAKAHVSKHIKDVVNGTKRN